MTKWIALGAAAALLAPGPAFAAPNLSLAVGAGENGASPAPIEIRDYDWVGVSRLPESNQVSHRSGVLMIIFDGGDGAVRHWWRTHQVIPSMTLTVADDGAETKYALEHCTVSSWSSFGNAQHATIVYQTVSVTKAGAD